MLLLFSLIIPIFLCQHHKCRPPVQMQSDFFIFNLKHGNLALTNLVNFYLYVYVYIVQSNIRPDILASHK